MAPRQRETGGVNKRERGEGEVGSLYGSMRESGGTEERERERENALIVTVIRDLLLKGHRWDHYNTRGYFHIFYPHIHIHM